MAFGDLAAAAAGAAAVLPVTAVLPASALPALALGVGGLPPLGVGGLASFSVEADPLVAAALALPPVALDAVGAVLGAVGFGVGVEAAAGAAASLRPLVAVSLFPLVLLERMTVLPAPAAVDDGVVSGEPPLLAFTVSASLRIDLAASSVLACKMMPDHAEQACRLDA